MSSFYITVFLQKISKNIVTKTLANIFKFLAAHSNGFISVCHEY